MSGTFLQVWTQTNAGVSEMSAGRGNGTVITVDLPTTPPERAVPYTVLAATARWGVPCAFMLGAVTAGLILWAGRRR